MATIQELSGLLAGALEVDPMLVDTRVRGLTEAGRLDLDNLGCSDAADLLLAIIGTDPRNVTGPAHLPLSSVLRTQNGNQEIINGGDPRIAYADVEFGHFVADFIQKANLRPTDSSFVKAVSVGGQGNNLVACVSVESGGISISYWFGYRVLPQLLDLHTHNLKSVYRSATVGGAVLSFIAELLEGKEPVLPCVPTFEYLTNAEVH